MAQVDRSDAATSDDVESRQKRVRRTLSEAAEAPPADLQMTQAEVRYES